MTASRTLRTLGAAANPALGGRLARLTKLRASVAERDPHPLVIGVVPVGEAAGASTLAALVAQRLATLAPRSVAVLDADAKAHPQRALLGAGETGSLRGLVADPVAHRQRRRIEAHLARSGSVPLLADAGAPFTIAELDTALSAVTHRYPVVVVDVPHGGPGDAYLTWLSERAGYLLAVVPVASIAARDMTAWLAERVTAQPPCAGVVQSWAGRPDALLRRAVAPRGMVTLRWPAVRELRGLSGDSPVLVDDLGLTARYAVETCVAQATAGWPRGR